MRAIKHLTFFFTKRDTNLIGFIFAFNSLLFGNWITRIPDIKIKLNLDDASLGLALLAAPIGALAIMPLSGWVIEKIKVGKATFWAALCYLFSFQLLANATSLWSLTLGLFIFGTTNALMDVAMNAIAALREKELKKPIMSTCHGMWSFGAMLGSAMGSFIVGLKISIFYHFLFILVIFLILILSQKKILFSITQKNIEGDKVFALPNLSLFSLAIIGFCVLMSEGAIADWSAIYMKETLLSEPYMIGLAYSSFSFFMALGRFFGDAIIPIFGNKKVVIFGSLLSFFGLGITLILGNVLIAIIGFGVTGLGFSCIVPIIFSSASREPGFATGTGIAAVTSISYTGFLIGPPFIGFVANFFGMPIGLSLIVFACFLIFSLSMLIKFK